MSNEIFESLYKQYEAMIYLFIKKYKGLLEEDDIRQCCLIAIVKAYKTYKSNKDTKFSNWIYNNMQWAIYKEIRDTKHLTRDCISLETKLDSDSDSLRLIDVLEDDTVNIEAEIEDKIMYEVYRKEIIRCLDSTKADVMILKHFQGVTNSYIEKTLDITGVSNYVIEARMTLIRKSKLFREEYNRIHHIDDYTNPERISLYSGC